MTDNSISTVRIVYNACFGGFGLSHKAIMRYLELCGKTTVRWEPTEKDPEKAFAVTYYVTDSDGNESYFNKYEINRADPRLVQVIDELGKAANSSFSDLAICEVSLGERYRIDEYDGSESVMTVDDYEWTIAGKEISS